MRSWLFAAAALALSCGSREEDSSAHVPPARVTFKELSSRLGFQRQSLPDAEGLGGAAWFDYDNDGDVDLFLTNGVGQPLVLYRNDGAGEFEDVTQEAGLLDQSGTTAAIAGDIDNDGFLDLFLVGAGGVTTPVRASAPVLYKNNGDGTFTKVLESGVLPLDGNGRPESASWSASMADLDGDGDLEIFLDVPGNLWLAAQGYSRLYRNEGDFKFTDITEGAGLASANLGACASGFSDYDNDGDVDLFVANCLKFRYNEQRDRVIYVDAAPVQLFRNDGELTFTEVTEASGLGESRGEWMAVSYADFNHDGNIDFFSTDSGTVRSRPHGLFLNNGDGTFSNIAEKAGVATFEFGWGAAASDFDNDGFADIFLVGSQPLPPSNVAGTGLANPGRLFINENSSRDQPNTFVQNTEDGFRLANQFTSGVATGDLDNDGFQDLVIVREQWPRGSDSGQPCLMKNNPNSNHWVGLALESTSGNRFAVGARATVRSQTACQVQEIYSGTSFGSTDSHRLNFGVGKDTKVVAVVVRWASGAKERFVEDIGDVDRIYRIVEGTGRPIHGEHSWEDDCDEPTP